MWGKSQNTGDGLILLLIAIPFSLPVRRGDVPGRALCRLCSSTQGKSAATETGDVLFLICAAWSVPIASMVPTGVAL